MIICYLVTRQAILAMAIKFIYYKGAD
ncbi:hypothetical protein CGRA01v4_13213 [Colletotrichum graminicola]|nr:hypothetical protein CGRA01v4_13213 [Colletotrichum graminicola]